MAFLYFFFNYKKIKTKLVKPTQLNLHLSIYLKQLISSYSSTDLLLKESDHLVDNL